MKGKWLAFLMATDDAPSPPNLDDIK